MKLFKHKTYNGTIIFAGLSRCYIFLYIAIIRLCNKANNLS